MRSCRERIERLAEDRLFLRYSAVLDDRVRPDHAGWRGTVLAIDDPRWRTRYPPNGWRCRCTVTQHDAGSLGRLGRDDEAGTVEGNHSQLDALREAFAEPTPYVFGNTCCSRSLEDPVHNPADFLLLLAPASRVAHGLRIPRLHPPPPPRRLLPTPTPALAAWPVQASRKPLAPDESPPFPTVLHPVSPPDSARIPVISGRPPPPQSPPRSIVRPVSRCALP